ncbi:MAG: Fic family protein [Fulvivirga sp.]
MDKFKEINTLLLEYKNAIEKKPWTKEFLDDLKNDITYHSNKIEGMSLPYGETIQFLKYGLITNAESKIKDITDLQNHKEALDLIFNQYSTLEISVENIKLIHKFLLNNPLNKTADIYSHPGEYKEDINGTIRDINGKSQYHEYLAPPLVPGAMNRLMEEINRGLNNVNLNKPENHPITISVYFHYQFSNVIHPFNDGNGRIARLYSNLILMKNDFPAIPIKGDGEEKAKYFNAFYQCEEENKLDPLLDIFFDQLSETMTKGINLANKN